jgi:hypothetical protein
MKKTAVDRFNDNRQEETHRLNLKRKMEHDEKMASIRLKRHKYELRYGSTPQTPGSSTPAVATQTGEDKQIEILRLQIRLAELTRDNSAASAQASSSSRTLSQMPHNLLEEPEVSTPSSGSLSFFGGHNHNGFVDNNYMTSDHRYRPQAVNDANDASGPGEASSVGVDTTRWAAETYNFSA